MEILTGWIDALFQPYLEAAHQTISVDIDQAENGGPSMGSSQSAPPPPRNSLSRFNEFMQKRHQTVDWICKQGANNEWTALILVDNLLIGRGKALRKKQAKIKAARSALSSPFINDI